MARFLLSATGAAWLERAMAAEPSALPLGQVTWLRQHLAPDQAAAVLEQVRLRRRAAGRFERAAQMLFTDAGLQQSTHPLVAAHRAERFRGGRQVADLGCGLGGDTLALARVAPRVLALDRDMVRLLFARHNVRVNGVAQGVTWVLGDLLAGPFSPRHWLCFADPGRRTASGRRLLRADAYEPPLSRLALVLGEAEGAAVKVSPGIDYEALSWADEVEVVSLRGAVKEVTLWCGALSTPGVRRRATVLPAGVTVTDTQPEAGCAVGSVGRYVYEPDGAVVRAGLVRQVGTRLGLWQLDPRIAYLSGDEPVTSPLVTGFEVEEVLRWGMKAVRQRLRALDVGTLEIKRRGVPLDPDEIRRRLKLRGSGHRTLIVVRIGSGAPLALVCRRLNKNVTAHPPAG